MLKSDMIAALVAIIAASAVILLSDPPLEDEPGWNCATMGNHVCRKV